MFRSTPISDCQSSICNLQSAIRNLKSAICNLQYPSHPSTTQNLVPSPSTERHSSFPPIRSVSVLH